MNEQVVLSKSPHEPVHQAICDSGGKPVSASLWGRSSFQELLSPFTVFAQPALRGCGSLLLLVVCWLTAIAPVLAQQQTNGSADLNLTKAISNQNPNIGDIVTYTVVVTNSPTSTTATNVVVTDQLLAEGVSYVASSATSTAGTTFSSVTSGSLVTGTWSIPSIAPGASATLVFQGKALAQGVWFNTAEITAADQTDPDSPHGNGNLYEDDYEAVCFAIPIFFYTGDEYTVSVPAGYDRIEWYRNDGTSDVLISTSAVSTSLAEVNSDNSLSIRSTGTYRFVTYKNGCASSNCCNIEMVPGALACLGDYVWADVNGNGLQDANETGINGVTVTLYLNGSATSQTLVTANGPDNKPGYYKFCDLTPGSSLSYAVGFTTPDNFTTTAPNVGDSNPPSFTVTNNSKGVPQSATLTLTNAVTLAPGETNLTLDQGYIPVFDVGIVKTVVSEKGSYLPGDQITYQLAITNNSAYPVYNVVVRDNLPTGVTYVSGGGFTASGQSLSTVLAGPIAVSATSNLTFVAQITPSVVGTTVTNFASVTPFTSVSQPDGYTPKDSNPQNNTSTVTVPLGTFACVGDYVWADLNGNGLQDDGDTGINGIVATLYINGSATSQTLVTANGPDNKPGYYKFANLTPGSNLSYAVGFTIPTGLTATIANAGGSSLTATNDSKGVPQSATLTLTNAVTLGNGEFNKTLDQGVLPSYDVGITKTVVNEKGSYLPGDQLVYQLTVSNNSAYPVYNVVVRDQLPASLSYVSGGGFTASGQSLSAVLAGPLTASGSVGSTTSLTFTAQISSSFSGTSITNVAIVTPFTSVSQPDGYTPKDSNPQNNTSTVTVPVGNFACVGDYVWVDLDGDGRQGANEPGLNGVVATLYINGSATSQTLVTADNAGQAGYYKFAGLTPGNSLSYSVGFTIPSGFTATVSNVGGLTATDNSKGVPQSATLTLTNAVTLGNGEFNRTLDQGVLPSFDVGVVKTVVNAKPSYLPGDDVTYQLAITNNSAYPVYNVVVRDELPSNLAYVSGGGFTASGQSLSTVLAGPVAAGATQSLTFTARISPSFSGTSLTNIALVTPFTSVSQPDGYVPVDTNPANNSSTVVVPVARPSLVVTVGTPVCNSATNTYSATGSVVLTNAPAGQLTVTDNGVVVLSQTVTAGSTTLPLTLTGVSDAGSHTVVASLTNGLTISNGTSYTAPVSCTVCPLLALMPNALPVTQIGTPLNQTLVASGGVAPYTYTVVGTLPAGLTLTTSGVLSGTPTSATVATFTVVVTDAKSCSNAFPYSLTTTEQPIPPALAVTVGAPVCNSVTNQYTVSGSVSLTAIPAGTLVVTDNGTVVLSQTIAAGTVTVPLTLTGVSDASSHTVVATFTNGVTLTSNASYTAPVSCTACPLIALMPNALPVAQVGSGFSQTLVASGGVAPYTYVVTGTLPDGVSFVNGVLSGTPTSATVVNFTVTVTDAKSCSNTFPYSLSVIKTCPPANGYGLTVTADQKICNGDKVTLIASTTVVGAKICWYLTPYDGVALATLDSGQPFIDSPTTTTIYYVEASIGECKSVRKPVSVSVTTVPTPICLGNAKNTCPEKTVDLTKIEITNGESIYTYEWYTSITRSTTSLVTNTTAVGAGKYYLFAKLGNCYSNPTVLTVEIVDCNCQNVAGVDIGPGVSVCEGQPVPLTAVLTGSATSVTWSSKGSGTFSSLTSTVTTYTPSADDAKRGFVELTATTNDPDGNGGVCQPATSSKIVDINPRPKAPINLICEDVIACKGKSTTVFGVVADGDNKLIPGMKINWYNQNNVLVGTSDNGAKLAITPTASGTLVYQAEAVSPDGCISPRSSLTIVVQECLADLAVLKTVVTPAPYTVGQVITYSVKASNNGPETGNAVKVTDVLPASLAYVSATAPTGTSYNAGTGVWTIGTLAKDDSRTLLIEARILTAGSIKNTGVISGSNNDPKYPDNDESSVTIDAKACDVQPPHIACAVTEICVSGSTKLTAEDCKGGKIVWSDGQDGFVVDVRPQVTTIYTASCVKGECVSAASNPITVTVLKPQAPNIIASADKVCPGASVTLTASGCEGGTIRWSEGEQTTASIVVQPTGKTTYTAQCVIGSCPSGPATKTIDIQNNLPKPTVTCSTGIVCPGESVTLTVNNCLGTPVWNSTTATTASIVVQPTAGNNDYTVYCQRNGCTSPTSDVYSISVVAPTVPSVTATSGTICANQSVTLTASGCNGMVIWNALDRQGNARTGNSIVVAPDANISYYAQCRYRTCLSDPSKAVDITIANPTTPEILLTSGKDVICSGEQVTLTAENCNGTLKWYGVTGGTVAGSSVSFFPTQSMDYYATCVQGQCESQPSLKVRVTVRTTPVDPPKISASTTAVCANGVVSLSATGCTNGTIKWSDGQTGSVVSVTVTPTNKEFYAICTPNSGTACGSGKSNVVSVKVTETPMPTVICSTDKICPGESVTLTVENCSGTPYWSTSQTITSIVVSPTATTAYSVYCQDGTCRSPQSKDYTITVTPVPAPTITASATVVEPGASVTLTASNCPGEVIWNATDGNGNNKGAILVVVPNGTQTYYAQCRYRSCLSDPSITIVVNPGSCVAKAGTLTAVNGTVCSGTASAVTIAASPNGGLVVPEGYSVLYVLTKGSDLVIQKTSATPSFTVAAEAANYTIHTLVYNATPGNPNFLDLSVVQPGVTTGGDVVKLIADRKVCADLDVAGAKVSVKFVAPPRLYAGPSLTVCAGASVTLGAIGCDGGTVTWSNGMVGNPISLTVNADLWLMATCTVDGCTSKESESIDVMLGTPGVPTIGVDKPSICAGEQVTLTATGCDGGTYMWSDGSTTSSILKVKPTADASYRVRCKVGECVGPWSEYTTIKVGAPAAPVVSVLGSGTVTSTTVCFGTPVTLQATGCPAGSYAIWSNDLAGSTITVSLARSVTYTARCCTSNNCKSDASNAVILTVLPKVAQPQTIDLVNACPFNTVNLSMGVSSSASTTGGIFEYYTDASLSSASKVTNYTAVGTGTYYAVEKTANGCYSLPGIIHVQIITCGEQTPCQASNPATAGAGPDASICAAKTYKLNGVMGGAGSVSYWKSSGTGTFDNPFLLNATYTASAADVLSGTVTLTLSVSTNNAACPVAKDAMVLTIQGSKSVPTVKVIGNTNLCYGETVVLEAPAGAPGYLWSNGAKTQSLTVSATGAYSVMTFDQNGCSSIKSDDVIVKVANPVTAPIVSNLRNTCSANTADLTTALAAMNTGSTYEFRLGQTPTSSMVVNTSAVGEGLYYVFERNAQGCVSAGAAVSVNIVNCNSDTQTDLSITKLASVSSVTGGQPVTYTITVTNTGSQTATNVDVRDILPAGLELVPVSTTAYAVSNGVISTRFASILPGQSASISFQARVLTKKQVITNTAAITYLDQTDTNPANNTASVGVQDPSEPKTSLAGIAKAVGVPVLMGDSLFSVRYSFIVRNYGDDVLTKVQVSDDLAFAFAPHQVASTTVTLGQGSTLKLDPTFTGTGNNTNLLDMASTIQPSRSELILLDVLVRRSKDSDVASFSNIAQLTAMNSVTSLSDMSVSGGDPDPDADGDPTNNTGVTSFTLPQGPQGPAIGLALAVVSVEKQADESFNVTYKATVKNFGNVDLSGISLINSLTSTFPSSVTYSVVSAPVALTGSSLVPNAAYDGVAQPDLLLNSSSLAVGVQSELTFVVNVKPGGNNGPFYSSATVSGVTAASQTVTDISNSGYDPTTEGALSTPVRFNLPDGLLGVAKAVGTPAQRPDGTFEVPYTIVLRNMGTGPLTNVQVVDKLDETFGTGALISSTAVSVSTSAGLAANPNYTGQGQLTNMLVSETSSLSVGQTSTLNFVVQVKLTESASLTFNNTAYATATSSSSAVVSATSTVGLNPDPDNDLDPTNNNSPTPVTLNNVRGSYIGIALSVRDTVRQADGTFNVTYQAVLKNYGLDGLKNVVVSDTLAKVFNNATGATYKVIRTPYTISTGSELKLNDKYNGDSEPLLVLGDSTSRLAVGKVDTILYVVNVATNGSTTTFLNTAYAAAIGKNGWLSDVSTAGTNPDPNGNGNPTDSNEREATALNLPAVSSTLFIPEGFSPNGDGINDLFVIRGTGSATISLQVFNRWGHLVYENQDYRNDWDGKPNAGIQLGTSSGLPDGTYYYVINLSDGRQFVRYMTINR